MTGHALFSPTLNIKEGFSYALDSDHDDRLEGEPLLAIAEQIFETVAQQLHHHDIVVSFNNSPFQFWDSLPFQQFQQLRLMQDLWVSRSVVFLEKGLGSLRENPEFAGVSEANLTSGC